MIELTLGDLAAVLEAELVGGPADTRVSTAVAIDSRAVVAGGIFVAVSGEQVDGHDFADDAARRGAVAVLGSRATSLPTLVVTDPVRALGDLARHVIGSLPQLTVLALTGSQGKTGTKDYLAGILSSVGETIATAGNYNNELGVPLTLLRAGSDTRFLVVEMGARARGDIAYLSSIARPRIAGVLNVGVAHLGEFGTQEEIAAAKGELVDDLPPDAVAVLNADDPRTMAMMRRTSARVLTFGRSGEVSSRSERSDVFGRPSFEIGYAGKWEHVSLSGLGTHQVANACAAAAMALAAGVALEACAGALTACRLPSRWRMELTERADGLAVINDAYNANPASMAAAIDTVAGIGARTGRRTVAVLGEMRELGSDSALLHREVGRHVGRSGIDVLVTVGAEATEIWEGAHEHASWSVSGYAASGRDEAIEWVRHNVSAADVVVVKASRGAALEHVAAALLDTGRASSAKQRSERDHQ
jgi:UDP-N-acetylmuramoyl-tripeptide--D-alanyl-D-alanine ligase